jgi:hypothetical protein
METLDFRSHSGQGPAPVPSHRTPNDVRKQAASLVDEQAGQGWSTDEGTVSGRHPDRG